MKIRRSSLIELVEKEIERLRDAAFQRAARSLERRREEETAYLERTRPAWLALAGNIAVALRENRPVLLEDVPRELRGYRDEIAVYRRREADSPEANTTHLETLLDVLRASDDDEVSTYGLEKMGFALGRTLAGRS